MQLGRADLPGPARGFERGHGTLEGRERLTGPEQQAHGEGARAAIGCLEERGEGRAYAIDPRGAGVLFGDRKLGQWLGVAGIHPHADVRRQQQPPGRRGRQRGILVRADRDLAGAGHSLAVEDDSEGEGIDFGKRPGLGRRVRRGEDRRAGASLVAHGEERAERSAVVGGQ